MPAISGDRRPADAVLGGGNVVGILQPRPLAIRADSGSRRSLCIAVIPTIGPSGRMLSAHRQPTAVSRNGMSQIVITVIEKPMASCTVLTVRVEESAWPFGPAGDRPGATSVTMWPVQGRRKRGTASPSGLRLASWTMAATSQASDSAVAPNVPCAQGLFGVVLSGPLVTFSDGLDR